MNSFLRNKKIFHSKRSLTAESTDAERAEKCNYSADTSLRAHFAKQSQSHLEIASSQRALLAMTLSRHEKLFLRFSALFAFSAGEILSPVNRRVGLQHHHRLISYHRASPSLGTTIRRSGRRYALQHRSIFWRLPCRTAKSKQHHRPDEDRRRSIVDDPRL